MYKPFDPQLNADNDERGRTAVKQWLASRGFRAEDFLPYEVDLIVKRGSQWFCFAEVEVRGWDTCQYDTIHIAKRKEKLLTNAMPTYMFVCGNSLQSVYVCDAKRILSSPLAEVRNIYVNTGEMFYDVPKSAFKRFDMTVDPF